MADSDDEYIGSSGDERGKRASNARKQKGAGDAGKERWEEIQRSWDNVVEGADGSISATVVGLLEQNKRKR
jgi:transcription initiation factor TFIIH subunit 2